MRRRNDRALPRPGSLVVLGSLVIVAVLCAAVSVYYYFRVVQAMYFREGDAGTDRMTDRFRVILLLNALIIVVLGIHPDWLLSLFNY